MGRGKKFGARMAGVGTMLFGVAWIAGGVALFLNKKPSTTSPQPNTQPPLPQRILAVGAMFWGLAMMVWGGNMMASGDLIGDDMDDGDQINYVAGPIDCSNIILYSLKGCPWCDKARAELVKRFGDVFIEHEYVSGMTTEPVKMPDGQVPHVFPQIWVNGRNMGGYTEMPLWVDNCIGPAPAAPQ